MTGIGRRGQWCRTWPAVALATASVVTLAESQGHDALVERGRQLLTARQCTACHTYGIVGTPLAPDLRGARARYREADLARWLRQPSGQEATRHMPDLGLTRAEAEALAAFLTASP